MNWKIIDNAHLYTYKKLFWYRVPQRNYRTGRFILDSLWFPSLDLKNTDVTECLPQRPPAWHGRTRWFLSRRVCSRQRASSCRLVISMLDTVAHIIQNCIVNRFPNIPYRSLHVRRCYYFVSSWCILICCQNTNLSSSHFLFMNVHSLYFKFEQSKKILFGRVNNIYNVHILRMYHMSIFQWILLHAPLQN